MVQCMSYVLEYNGSSLKIELTTRSWCTVPLFMIVVYIHESVFVKETKSKRFYTSEFSVEDWYVTLFGNGQIVKVPSSQSKLLACRRGRDLVDRSVHRGGRPQLVWLLYDHHSWGLRDDVAARSKRSNPNQTWTVL